MISWKQYYIFYWTLFPPASVCLIHIPRKRPKYILRRTFRHPRKQAPIGQHRGQLQFQDALFLFLQVWKYLSDFQAMVQGRAEILLLVHNTASQYFQHRELVTIAVTLTLRLN